MYHSLLGFDPNGSIPELQQVLYSFPTFPELTKNICLE